MRMLPRTDWPAANSAGSTGGNTITTRSPTGPDIHGRKKSAIGALGRVRCPSSSSRAWKT